MKTDWRPSLLSAIWGTLFFLVWGLVLIVGEIPLEWSSPYRFRFVQPIVTIIILPVGLLIGWIRYFPRWSYPYMGNTLLFSLYMMNVSTPGFLFGRELWGWRAWIPLLLIAAIATSVTRSFEPIIRFYRNITSDWSLLNFGMFGFMPLVMFAFYDEMDQLYSLYWMAALTILMCATAFLYLYSRDRRRQIAALIAGVVITVIGSILGPAIYWKETRWLFQLAVILLELLIMLSPAWIHLIAKTLPRKTA